MMDTIKEKMESIRGLLVSDTWERLQSSLPDKDVSNKEAAEYLASQRDSLESKLYRFATEAIDLWCEQKLEREQKLIDILNGMVKRLKPIYYSDFNREIVASNADSLAAFEKLHNEVGLKNIGGGDNEQLGTSTLAIIATITDVLVGRRLAATVTDDDEVIIGFQWFIPPDEKTINGRPFEIIINGKMLQHNRDVVTYDDVFQWYSMGRDFSADLLLTITFSDGPKEKPFGSLTKGEGVCVCDGMIFNATFTG